MQRILIIVAFLSLSFSAKGDVIFFPYQYTYASYSVEFIYSYEIAKKPQSSNVLWGGAGVVGSFFYLEEPSFGFEIAYERRKYFKSESFDRFFFSGYIGIAYMTKFRDQNDIGFVPGIKLNYKAQLTKDLLLEPYFGISLPVTLHVKNTGFYVPFPVATIGFRFGIGTLKRKY
jgi:hypothetical protein